MGRTKPEDLKKAKEVNGLFSGEAKKIAAAVMQMNPQGVL